MNILRVSKQLRINTFGTSLKDFFFTELLKFHEQDLKKIFNFMKCPYAY